MYTKEMDEQRKQQNKSKQKPISILNKTEVLRGAMPLGEMKLRFCNFVINYMCKITLTGYFWQEYKRT